MTTAYQSGAFQQDAFQIDASGGITFVASSTTANTVAGATLVINKPSGTIDGDLMIAVMDASTAGTTWTGDTGWTEVYDQGANPRLRIAYKVAASEGSSYTFTISSASAICVGAIVTYRNAAFDVIGTAATATGATPIAAPSITAAGGLLLACYGESGTNVTSFTTPSGMTRVVDNYVSANFAVFSETVAAGSTGTRTSTPTGGVAAPSTGILLALELSVQNYPIAADAGSYAVTGQAATLLRSKTLTANSGSYAVTGQVATLLRSKALSADAGSYAVTGQTAGVYKGRALAADAGSYAVSGQAAGVYKNRTLSTDAGSYTVNGQSATLLRSVVISAGHGTYAVTGQSVGVYKGRTLDAGQGAYVLSGQAAALIRDYSLTAGQGVYTVTGQDATLIKATNYTLLGAAGAYTVAGQAATFSLGYSLTLSAGAYTVTGFAALIQPRTWEAIPDTQNAGWSPVTSVGGDAWAAVPNTQTAVWGPSDSTASAGWGAVSTPQTAAWAVIDTNAS